MCHIRGVEMQEIMKGLRQPFPLNQTYIKLVSTIHNKGKDFGYVVPYIKLYSIKNRLDEVVGPGYWKLETRDGREGFIVSLRCLSESHTMEKVNGSVWSTVLNILKKKIKAVSIQSRDLSLKVLKKPHSFGISEHISKE